MSNQELWRLSADELSPLTRSGEIRPSEAVASALARMDAVNPALNAVVEDLRDEALARAEVLGRRRQTGEVETGYKVGDLELDRLSHEVRRAGKPIVLQPREFRLLEYLMKHAGQVVTRTMLLENVWDYHFDPQTNVIDVHISRLRSKIERDFDTALLHTVRGSGYIMRDGT